MVATRAQKRIAADSRNPLLNLGILKNVLSYVGPRHYLFVALVSKGWKGTYSTLKNQQVAFESSSEVCTCVPQTTLHRAVFASPSRVKLAQQSRLDCTSWIYRRAAGTHADIATLATAREMGMQFTATTMAGAAYCNKLAVSDSQGCPWSALLLELAARRGYFELVRWCFEHGCCFEDASEAMLSAVDSGSVELMAWMLQQPGMQLCEKVMSICVFRGHMALCQYLHAQQCPWNTVATSQAALDGHIDILRWLLDNGCPCDEHKTGLSAGEGGSIEVLTYMQQQGMLTSPALLTEMLDIAAVFDKLAAAQWLREQGAQWPDAFRHYLSAEALVWARAEGCTAIIILAPEDV
jgi:hypothetical protein